MEELRESGASYFFSVLCVAAVVVLFELGVDATFLSVGIRIMVDCPHTAYNIGLFVFLVSALRVATLLCVVFCMMFAMRRATCATVLFVWLAIFGAVGVVVFFLLGNAWVWNRQGSVCKVWGIPEREWGKMFLFVTYVQIFVALFGACLRVAVVSINGRA